MYTLEKFCFGLGKLFYNCSVDITEDNLIIKRNFNTEQETEENKEEVLCNLNNESINSIIQIVNQKSSENYSLYDSKCFEIAVKPQDNDRFPLFRYHDEEQHKVSEHGYTLCLSKASQEYIVSTICSIADSDILAGNFLISFRHRIHRGFSVNEFQDFCDQFTLITVKITSESDCSHTEFNRMLNSYLFNIAYNTSIVFTPFNLHESREPRRLRVRRNGQLFPYKSYNNELIKYYYQAITASMPLTQYLAYYHVAEFFFQSIAENDAFSKIESIITHPSFSPHCKESIRGFYDKVKSIMKSQKEEGVWKEEIYWKCR